MKRIWRFFIPAISAFCTILSPQGNHAGARKVPYALVVRGGFIQVINTSGFIIADSLREDGGWFPHLDCIDEGMFVYVRDNKLGFKNHHNQVVVPPVYQLRPGKFRSGTPEVAKPYEPRFQNGLAIVGSTGNRFGIVNRSGQLIVDTTFDYIAPPDSGVYAARRGDTLFLLNGKGQNLLQFPYVTDPKLYPTPHMQDGRLCVMVRAGGLCYRDFAGLTTRNRFEQDGPSARDIHTYKAGFVDRKGRLAIDTVFHLDPAILGNSDVDLQRSILEGGICGTGMQQISKRGRAVDPYYLRSDFYEFRSGRCLVWNGSQQIVIGIDGDSLFTIPRGIRIRNIRGFFSVDEAYDRWRDSTGKYSYHCGLYNPSGRVIVPMNYYRISEGNAGFFVVDETPYGSGGDYFYVDSTGTECFGRRFVRASAFDNGYAMVTARSAGGESPRSARLDTSGRLYDSRLEELYLASDEYIVTGPPRSSDTTRMGIKAWDRHWILPPKHRALTLPGCGLIGFAERPPGSHTDRWGYLDMEGRVVIEPQFQAATSFQLVELCDTVERRRWRLFRPGIWLHRKAGHVKAVARP